MNPTDALHQQVIDALEKYEEKARRYCFKVEEDRPAVASAHWDAVWTFRKDVLLAIAALRRNLRQAQQARDPG